MNHRRKSNLPEQSKSSKSIRANRCRAKIAKSTCDNRDSLTDAELAEARRIADELAKLHARGIIKNADDPEARFYASMLNMFGGTVLNADKATPDDAPVRDLEDALGDGDDL